MDRQVVFFSTYCTKDRSLWVDVKFDLSGDCCFRIYGAEPWMWLQRDGVTALRDHLNKLLGEEAKSTPVAPSPFAPEEVAALREILARPSTNKPIDPTCYVRCINADNVVGGGQLTEGKFYRVCGFANNCVYIYDDADKHKAFSSWRFEPA